MRNELSDKQTRDLLLLATMRMRVAAYVSHPKRLAIIQEVQARFPVSQRCQLREVLDNELETFT